MISSVRIRGYRAFRQFEMNRLGRLNLLVGRNNCGKTSLLESLYILASSGAGLTALWTVLARRGEQLLPDPSPGRPLQAEADISHLFHGHDVNPGSELTISTTNEKPALSVRYHIDEASPDKNPQLFALLSDEGAINYRLALHIAGTPEFSIPPVPLTRSGTIRIDTLQRSIAGLRQIRSENGSAQFVTTESLTVSQLSQLWQSIVLTPDEERATRALQIIESSIERIAQVQTGPVQFPGQGFVLPSRGGFFVRVKDDERRFPIGSFGDGVWRMFAIAVALVRAKDSLLLIDEIDTGLHYTVMADMWKLVFEAAALFNVQVFATTHSYDCVHSLASVCRPNAVDGREVTIQRVEQNKSVSIPFSEAEIAKAAEREIEIR